jgi:tetratricopeptide (TPR) repeat protein
MNEGNRHWQEFLAAPGHAYIEIQGGLATTQSEYRAMPGGAQWTWAEAYGLLEADPKVVHGPWSAATRHVEQKVEQIIPARKLEEELIRTAAWADLPPTEILHHGAGWGALEKRRRARSGSKPFASDAMPFDDESLTAEQEQWLALLEKGELPAGDPAKGPGSFLVQSEWHTLLEEAVRQNRGNHWLSWYHLGIMRYRAQDPQGARAAWEKSMQLQPTGWAKRNLAQLARDSKDDAAAAQLWLEASRLLPDVVQLAIECSNALLQVRRFKDLLSHQATLPQTVRENWRMQMLSARASLGEGDLEAVRRYFDSDINPASVREQEVALTDIWFEMHEAAAAAKQGKPLDDEARRRVRTEFPPPRRIDFRLRLETDADQSER